MLNTTYDHPRITMTQQEEDGKTPIWINPSCIVSESIYNDQIDVVLRVNNETDYNKLTHLISKGLIFNILCVDDSRRDNNGNLHTENYEVNKILPTWVLTQRYETVEGEDDDTNFY